VSLKKEARTRGRKAHLPPRTSELAVEKLSEKVHFYDRSPHQKDALGNYTMAVKRAGAPEAV